MDKIVLNPVTNTNSLSAINQNFKALADELQDKVLYRDNPNTQPNAMNNSLDMDGNDVINVSTLGASSVLIDGVDISLVIEQEAGAAIAVSQAAANLSLQYSQYSQASAASASDSALTASTAASTIGTSVIDAENFAIDAGISASDAQASADSIAGGPVASVNTKTGIVVIGKSDIGLPNVDNTSDSSKPVSTAQQNAINAAVGKGALLVRTTVYTIDLGTQYVSVNGGSPTTTGASTFSKQTATNYIIAELCGGGGGGGGTVTTNGSQQSMGAPGGGAGYGIGLFATGLTGLSVTVGAPGTAGAAGGDGGTGGTTSLGSLMSGLGGPGGGKGATLGAVGNTNPTYGSASPTGANIVGYRGGIGSQAVLLALGTFTTPLGGPSGLGNMRGYGVGGGGKYGPISTSAAAGNAADGGGILIVREYT